MKLETFKSPTTEVFLEFDAGTVSVNVCEAIKKG